MRSASQSTSRTSKTSAEDRCQLHGASAERVERARASLFDEDTANEVAEIFRALGDSSRAKIVYSLLQQELCTCDLAAITGTSESSVSQHLRILRQLRLVKSQRRGKQVFYSLDDTHIRILLLVCLNHVRDDGKEHPELHTIFQAIEQEQ